MLRGMKDERRVVPHWAKRH